uniref:Uncharacterized protein n=1 Tax=Meloidogyne enterolobii TaxID=390850 RepID=A0A6V7WSB9_MELEN|nr:unnamed protein product [Meloidogyne enterolobii]
MKVSIFCCFITTLIVGCFVSLIDGETVEKDIKKLEKFFKDELNGIGVHQIDTSRINQKDAEKIAKYGVHVRNLLDSKLN